MQLLNWNKATSSQLPLPPLATVPGILRLQTRSISLMLPWGGATFPSLSSIFFPKERKKTARFSRASCCFSGEPLLCVCVSLIFTFSLSLFSSCSPLPLFSPPLLFFFHCKDDKKVTEETLETQKGTKEKKKSYESPLSKEIHLECIDNCMFQSFLFASCVALNACCSPGTSAGPSPAPLPKVPWPLVLGGLVALVCPCLSCPWPGSSPSIPLDC